MTGARPHIGPAATAKTKATAASAISQGSSDPSGAPQARSLPRPRLWRPHSRRSVVRVPGVASGGAGCEAAEGEVGIIETNEM